ncbi:MAG: hypothetical protein HOI46_04515, partial [Rhodospirillaceae bacterium]|nr:hypothetical protein [Rhodospirillaceae bacterium]
VTLTKGDDIFQGDTLVTAKGAAVGITFIDDTTFSLGEEGRMVIDEMVYDADTQEGEFSANLVQGVFSFVSGEIAKTSPDGMTVTTPVATIGIRGTKVAGRAAQEGAENTISLLPETDPQGNQIVGELSVTNQGGTVTLNAIGATVQMSSAFQAPPPPVTFSQQQLQQNYGAALTTLSTAAAAKAEADAAEGAAEAEQAEAEAQAAEAEAEAAAAEAEVAQAEADAAQAEAEASGDPEAIAAAEAAQAEAEAKAVEAEAAQAEAETAAQEAEAKSQEAEQAQAEAEQANNDMQAQAQAFQAFGGPVAGEAASEPVEGAPADDGDNPVDAAPPVDNGGETFNGDSNFGGGDTLDDGGDILFGSGDNLFGDSQLLFGGGGDDLFGDPLSDPLAGGDALLFGYEPLPPDFFVVDNFDEQPPDDSTQLTEEEIATIISDTNAVPTVSLSVDSTQTLGFTSSGTTTFDSFFTNPFGDGASEIIDVDNDGDMDIVIHGYETVVGTNPASTFVGINNGSGTFDFDNDSGAANPDANPFTPAIANSLYTRGMDMADLNGDGNVDIVFAQNSATAQPVYLGDGIGGFTVLTQNDTINTTGGTIGGNNVALADFDGDGLKDMFVNVDAGAKVFLNAQNGDAAGQFTDTGQSLTSTKTAQSYRAVATGDIDGDGDIDTVTGSWGEKMDIWVNDGTGTFSNTGVDGTGRLSVLGVDNTTWGATNGVALGDVDGDGDLDVVAFNRYVANKVFLNDGTGTFTEGTPFGNLVGSGDGTLADIDGDGDLDAIDAGYGGVVVSTNDGTGTFTPQSHAYSTASSDEVQTGDLNGDGVTDILVGRYGSGSDILTNTSSNATVLQANTLTFQQSNFGITDPDNPANSSLVITVLSVPANGSIALNGTALSAFGTFTQADVIAGLVTYTHSGTATTTDSFQFDVSDGLGGLSATATFDLSVTSNSGNDTLTGGTGNDTLTGGAGNDTINGVSGTDTAVLNGVKANYTYAFAANGDLTLTDTVGTDGTDTLSNIDTLAFNDGNVGITSAKTITGDAGVDTITASEASSISTAAGNDVVTVSGATVATLDGGTGTDLFYLAGSSAAQTIRFTTSTDGATTANSVPARNQIFDFTQGTDKIGISGSLASLIDDSGAADGVITWASNAAVDFTGTDEALFVTDSSNFAGYTGQGGFPGILAGIISGIGMTSALGDDGLIVANATGASAGGGAGIFYFQEDGVAVNNVTADELTYIASIEGTAISSGITSDINIVS